MEGSVLVFLEHTGKEMASISRELVSEGARLSSLLKVPLTGVAVGHGLEPVLAEMGWYGCDQIYYVEDERLGHFTSMPYAKAVIGIIRKYRPQIVLFGATTTGRDMAPRVASALGCGLTADCTAFRIGDHKTKEREYKNILLQIRPAFGGNIIATIVSPESVPSMATVRQGVLKLSPPDRNRQVVITREMVEFEPNDFLTEIIELIRKEKEVDLQSAHIIVSAGMGAADSHAIELVRELANMLGGAVGASRAAVDSGLLSKDHQIGQTGTTVRPNLYIACGISGQIQHRAGMSESKRIIAINTDPEAPIFQIAHYGIVGDVKEVLSRMIKAYKEKD